jgi:acetoin utilization deacetylase AcuC-like enzyme
MHQRDYVERILESVPQHGYKALDPDTSMSPGSGEAALRAAGALCAAVDEIMSGKITNAFCAVRPPGHHAEESTAMGFCLFNNVAIGAAHAIAAHKLSRVAIIDWDVHHGNGTEEWVKKTPQAFFVSSHQFPFYPGTGYADDHGPHSNILNLPLPHRADSMMFRNAMQNFALPALEKFKPEMLFISAGFDAHRDDPLAGLLLDEGDYSWITSALCKLGKRFCDGRIISTLEGGYNIEALARSAGVHVKALMSS